MAGGGCKKKVKRQCKPQVNGFILFFLKMLKKNPTACVTRVAKMAGKCWRGMSRKERCKYIMRARRRNKGSK